jgi:anaerobic magnesium-protoporphyrin IX monomethyl ester cyclase
MSEDIHLIFPPQWSPFQPFLSTPSLKAFLQLKGFTVRQSDWNIEFYHYFIDRGRLPRALERLERYVHQLPGKHEAYRNQALFALGILRDFKAKRKLAEQLRSADCGATVEEFHESVTAFKRLLHAFSVAEPIVDVGTSSLSAGNVMASTGSIDDFCHSDEDNPFLPFFRSKVAAIDKAPRYFGISVIGTEQILPSLTLGACLKARFPNVPILIGGSVFSRLVDRTHAIRHFFDRYFDVIVRYEGENPLERFLSSSNPQVDRTPGIAFPQGDEIVLTDLATQLDMEQIPTPDFSGLDLKRYFTPELVLPILSTRGCYWDKCAFCYHGMIYGDRYRMRAPKALLDDVTVLNARHGVTHFALNDEAIPPKLFEKLPDIFPKQKYHFTGLYKFEKFFEPKHYQGMFDIGFRSLYIGLESANERVQRHMKKNNTQAVMLSNLRDAHAAGIWNHTFNFFGFPTETREEAMETAEFLVDHADIIHSEGTGTFSFEHNAPISKHPETFGVAKVIEKNDDVLQLYYDYEVTTGLTQEQATDMVEVFKAMKRERKAYQYGGWIPREHLLVLLGRHKRDVLSQKLAELDAENQAGVRWNQNVTWFAIENGNEGATRYFVVNSKAGTILETNRDAVLLLEFMPKDVPVETITRNFPVLQPVLAG